MPLSRRLAAELLGTGQAIFVGGWALQQLWLFWLAPLVGAAFAGWVFPRFLGESEPSLEKPQIAI